MRISDLEFRRVLFRSDLGALLLARAQRGGEFGLFAVRPRGDDLVIDADIAANHPEQAARCRRRANAIVAEYRIDIAGTSAVQQEAYPEVEILGVRHARIETAHRLEVGAADGAPDIDIEATAQHGEKRIRQV